MVRAIRRLLLSREITLSSCDVRHPRALSHQKDDQISRHASVNYRKRSIRVPFFFWVVYHVRVSRVKRCSREVRTLIANSFLRDEMRG